ncbi:DUF6779 domain-containing protein [Actinomycetospora chibensis]|uniref:DUF6779 domain-containing protein n=1 Tax=Actinomycetospora chibensis TaxID=663606 RepID=A0ABV9RQ54_9PSEU|nr:DUF6779 domain-containing protein [Actinomycetospora chibensis]MDD7925234.1 hypothetical protein [Actinomycetospora chibensis]
MSTPDGELRGRAGPDRRRAALLATAATLAALAAAAVVLADDARWLRLGVVAALWAAVVAGIVVARHARGAAGADEAAQDAAADLAAAQDEADDVVAALRREHDLELAREAAAREESERAAEKAREDAASLREQLERMRLETGADAVTLQSAGMPVAPQPLRPLAPRPRDTRLRVVGDSGPLPAGRSAAVPPPVPPPTPLRPAVPVAPAPRSGGGVDGRRAVTSRPVSPPPARADVPPTAAGASVVATGSFVDQYVRSAGYEPPTEVAPEQALEQALEQAPAPGPGRPDERPGRRSAPDETSRRSTDSDSGGRTVAELLAAHAANGRAGGRRRREP